MLFLRTLAISEVVGHSPFNIVPLAVEISFRFKDSSANQRIEPPAHLRHLALKFECAQFNFEFFDQQLPEIGFDLVVPGTAGEVTQKVGGRLRLSHPRMVISILATFDDNVPYFNR